MKLGQNRILTIVILLAVVTSSCVTSSGSPLSFRLVFPATVDVGELWLVENVNCFTCGNGEKDLGRAMGVRDIKLPAARWFVSLRMPKDASHLLPYLKNPSLIKIGDLQLQGSDVRDDDLRHIAEIDLRSINLSKTKITGAGLKYLRPNRKWTFVDLTDCDALDPEHLTHFRGWRRSTIRLTSHKWGDDKYNEMEMKLLDRAKQIICEGQPEEVCGTQIR